jgi:hypothetical protein
MLTSLIYFFSALFCVVSYADTLPTSTLSRGPASESTASVQHYVFKAGTYTEFYNQVQIDTAGRLKEFDRAPTLGFGLEMPVKSYLSFIPEIDWVLPRKSAERVVKNIFFFRADLGFAPMEWFRIRTGTSLVWLNQQGGGGKEVLNNGNSTSTFYYPIENRSSFNNTLDLGAELLLKKVSLRFQTYTFAALEPRSRQISYSIFLSYYWER